VLAPQGTGVSEPKVLKKFGDRKLKILLQENEKTIGCLSRRKRGTRRDSTKIIELVLLPGRMKHLVGTKTTTASSRIG